MTFLAVTTSAGLKLSKEDAELFDDDEDDLGDDELDALEAKLDSTSIK